MQCTLCRKVHCTIQSTFLVVKETDRLRKNNLANEDILTINLIAGYFNFVNRIALGLGAASAAAEVEGYDTGISYW